MGDFDVWTGQGVRVRLLRPADLSTGDRAAWRDLGARALEPNVYLSPEVVLPALTHLDPTRPVNLLFIEKLGCDADLVAALAFDVVSATSDLPVPHLRAYRSLHSFLGGVLLDREHAEFAIGALLDFLAHHRGRWHGLELPLAWADGPTHELLQAACGARGHAMVVDVLYQRPVLCSQRIGDGPLPRRQRLRDLRRRERRLNELGIAQWRWSCGTEVSNSHVDAFLQLEHAGWKGAAGTSIRSDPHQVAYLREVVARLAVHNEVFFTELLLDGRVIASTCNFTSGDMAHAFKVAWDPSFARTAPGYLSELEIMRNARSMVPHLRVFESGGTDEAYVADLWNDRRPLANTTITTTAIGRSALQAKLLYVATRGRLREGVTQAALQRYELMPLIDHAIEGLSLFL